MSNSAYTGNCGKILYIQLWLHYDWLHIFQSLTQLADSLSVLGISFREGYCLRRNWLRRSWFWRNWLLHSWLLHSWLLRSWIRLRRNWFRFFFFRILETRK